MQTTYLIIFNIALNAYFLNIVAPITYWYKNLSAWPGVIEPAISKNKHSMLIIIYIHFGVYWYEIFLQLRIKAVIYAFC